MNNKKMADMGFTQNVFPQGTHMCMIYSHEKERQGIIGKFIESGLLAGEQVAYYADVMKPDEVRQWLGNMDVDLPDDNSMSISVAENTYCPGGEFIPEKMLHTLRLFYTNSVNDGYPGARVSGEMSWALKGIPGSDRLMEYEALINEVFITHPVTAICQYDANKFSGSDILDVLKVHPMMVVHGQIIQNPYYMKPQDFLKDYSARSVNCLH